MDISPPGSSIHGILQARILELVAILFSRGSSQTRDWTQVSCTAGRFFTNWANRETLWIGESICKWYDWQGVKIQNIQTAHTIQYKKMSRRPEKTYFSQEDIQMPSRYMKRFPVELITREMQILIQTTARYHLIPVRMAVIKNITNKCWWGCGETAT